MGPESDFSGCCDRDCGANALHLPSSATSRTLMKDLFLGPFERREPIAIAGRVMLLLLFVAWSWQFLSAPMSVDVMNSFMHDVNLPFHEAGHIIFSPFGRFMSVLGGSLAQLLVPLICLVALLVQTRDPFGASLCLWWLGESLVDLAPYIADARALQLVLLGGRTGAEVEGHDWEFILGSMGWLHLDRGLGQSAHRLGALFMIAALVWSARVVTRQVRAARHGS